MKLTQKIDKPKELQKALKSMALSSKAASASNIRLNDIVLDETKNYSAFKSFFSSLSKNLASKLPPSPNGFIESRVTFCGC